MGPRIMVEIDDQGTVKADFMAFPGRSCEEAEKRLRRELARWGVVTRAVIAPKSRDRIALECALEASGKTSPQGRRTPCRTLSQ
jgi:hypothetical protein